MFDLPQTPLSNIQAGKLRALAVTGDTRIDVMPGVPTMAEAGLPEYNFGTWIGLAAPARTPPAIVARLHQEMVKALAQPDVKAAFAKQVMYVKASDSPEAYSAFIKSETERLKNLVQKANIKPEQ
jgi:tripartite-type tricarboxylate transporter receptor subunit TctC